MLPNKKIDNFKLGLTLGFLFPLIGVIIFKLAKLNVFSYKETFQYLLLEPGHQTITLALSLALLANALLFTLFININYDKAAKGTFIATCVWGFAILMLKFFG